MDISSWRRASRPAAQHACVLFFTINRSQTQTTKMHPKRGCCCSLCCDHVHNVICACFRARTLRTTHLNRLLSNELQNTRRSDTHNIQTVTCRRVTTTLPHNHIQLPPIASPKGPQHLPLHSSRATVNKMCGDNVQLARHFTKNRPIPPPPNPTPKCIQPRPNNHGRPQLLITTKRALRPEQQSTAAAARQQCGGGEAHGCAACAAAWFCSALTPAWWLLSSSSVPARKACP
jgi:hypothetical protein